MSKIKSYFILFIPLTVIAAAVILNILIVLAQEPDPAAAISFPVSALGDCADKASCRAYCDHPDNISACAVFAESQGLITKEKAAVAQKFAAIQTQGGGPGGCDSPKSCQLYCDRIDRVDECVSFAETNQLMDQDRLAAAKKIRQAIKNGIIPPGQCRTRETCDLYCSQTANIEECLVFAEQAGFLKDKELADA